MSTETKKYRVMSTEYRDKIVNVSLLNTEYSLLKKVQSNEYRVLSTDKKMEVSLLNTEYSLLKSTE